MLPLFYYIQMIRSANKTNPFHPMLQKMFGSYLTRLCIIGNYARATTVQTHPVKEYQGHALHGQRFKVGIVRRFL